MSTSSIDAMDRRNFLAGSLKAAATLGVASQLRMTSARAGEPAKQPSSGMVDVSFDSIITTPHETSG